MNRKKNICSCICPSKIKLVDIEGNKYCTYCGGVVVDLFTKQRKIGLM